MHRQTTVRSLVVAALLIAFISMPALAGESMKAKVIQVADGDTVIVSKGGRIYQVQIAGIDAPEITQDFGRQAYEYVRNLAKGEKVMIEIVESEGRSLKAHVKVAGQDIASTLVGAGLAWTNTDSPSSELKAAEERAKAGKAGLWASSDPTPPWEYRASA